MALQRTADADEPPTPLLLTIPPELRLNIYNHLTENLERWNYPYLIVWSDRVECAGDKKIRHVLNLLKICKEIYYEARVPIYSKISATVAFARLCQCEASRPSLPLAFPLACGFLRYIGSVHLRAYVVEGHDKGNHTTAFAELDDLLAVLQENRNLRSWTCSISAPGSTHRGTVYRAFKHSLDAFRDALQKNGVETEYIEEGKCNFGLHTQAESDSRQSEITRLAR